MTTPNRPNWREEQEAEDRAYYDMAEQSMRNINRYDDRRNRRADDSSNDDDSCVDKLFQLLFFGIALLSYFS